jgi:hypothetical protein
MYIHTYVYICFIKIIVKLSEISQYHMLSFICGSSSSKIKNQGHESKRKTTREMEG